RLRLTSINFRYRTELRYSASTSRSASEATAEPRSHVFDLLRSSFRYSPPESYAALEATIQKRALLSASARLSYVWAWQRPTLPGPCGPSTIGAGGLNGRVRDGYAWFPSAIITKPLIRILTRSLKTRYHLHEETSNILLDKPSTD